MDKPLKRVICTLFSRKTRRRGAVIVELCIVLPFIIWLTFAVIQYGVIFNTMITLTNLSRDCARFGALNANASGFDGGTSNKASIQYYLQQECQATNGVINYSDLPACPNGDAQPCIYDNTTSNPEPSSFATGDAFIAVVTYPMSKKIYLAPLVPGVSGLQANKSVTTQMMVQPPQTL